MKDSFRKRIYVAAAILYAVLLAAGTALSLNIGSCVSSLAAKKFPQATISNALFAEEDTGEEKAILKDFTLQEDGSIYSVTGGPWIVIPYARNGITDIYCVDIYVEEATNIGEEALVYYVSSYVYETFEVQTGHNIVETEKRSGTDTSLRLDLTAEKGQTMLVTTITVNDNAYVTAAYCRKWKSCTLWLLMLGAAAAVCIYRKHTCPHGPSQLFYAAVGFFLIWKLPIQLQSQQGWLMLVCLLVLLWLAVHRTMEFVPVWLSYAAVHICFSYTLGTDAAEYFFRSLAITPNLVLNLLLVTLLLVTLQRLLGRGLATLLYGVLFLLYTAANAGKLYYQGALLIPSDLQLLGELAAVIGDYIRPWMLLVFCGVLAFVGLLAVLLRRHLKRWLKPSFHISFVPYACVLLLFCLLFFLGGFSQFGMDTGQTYVTSKEQIRAFGYGFYTLLEWSGRMDDNKPDDYSAEIVDKVEAYVDADETESGLTLADSTEAGFDEAAQPIVILILAESVFEVDDLPDVTFNTQILSCLTPYKVANTISPAYGGRTVLAEWEALTGLSNLFISGDLAVYTSYLNKEGKKTGSIAREFHDNGYETVAIHANTETFYRRNIVYENMGFDRFISKEDISVSAEDLTNDNYIRDSVFADQIIETIEEDDEATFIFGASIESHGPYEDKFTETTIKAVSDVYSDDDLEELCQYAQAVYEFDQAMGRLIDYLEGCGRPVLLYIFGDHMPALSINSETGYLDDPYLQYCTPLYAYSNVCDVSVEDTYISTSQIAVEILKKSGISYRSYYDLIRAVGEVYPVTQKYVDSDRSDSLLQLYNEVQYDLLFGEQYLLQ